MLFLIGLGLGDAEDISLRGLKTIQSADYLYLENYTSLFVREQVDSLESTWECKPITLCDRRFVESQCHEICDHARSAKVVFLVVGDPFSATTHTDLVVRAKRDYQVQVETLHNASVLNAVGACGLQLYRFGSTVSIPFFTDDWTPSSCWKNICENRDRNLHTLCLLDIQMKEQTTQNLLEGNSIFEPPRFMSIHQALSQLAHFGCSGWRFVGCARLGGTDTRIIQGTFEDLMAADFGEPLHCLVVCAPEVHPIENEFLNLL